MRKTASLIAMLTLAASLSSFGGTSVIWYFNWGIYPHGAADLSATDAGTGVAATQSVLWQLLYAGDDGTIDPVNLATEGYVGGDDQVVFSRTIPAGGGSFDEWLGGSPAASETNASYAVGGILYMRVFGSTAPVLNDYYYDSPTLTFVEKNVGDTTQTFNGNTTSGDVGDALNIQIIAVPEPSTVALMLAGLAMVGYRRFRRA